MFRESGYVLGWCSNELLLPIDNVGRPYSFSIHETADDSEYRFALQKVTEVEDLNGMLQHLEQGHTCIGLMKREGQTPTCDSVWKALQLKDSSEHRLLTDNERAWLEKLAEAHRNTFLLLGDTASEKTYSEVVYNTLKIAWGDPTKSLQFSESGRPLSEGGYIISIYAHSNSQVLCAAHHVCKPSHAPIVDAIHHGLRPLALVREWKATIRSNHKSCCSYRSCCKTCELINEVNKGSSAQSIMPYQRRRM